jgi:hypothetical protein
MLDSHTAAGGIPSFRGSAMVVVAENAEAVKELLSNDIYASEGVWDLENAQIIPVSGSCEEFQPIHFISTRRSLKEEKKRISFSSIRIIAVLIIDVPLPLLASLGLRSSKPLSVHPWRNNLRGGLLYQSCHSALAVCVVLLLEWKRSRKAPVLQIDRTFSFWYCVNEGYYNTTTIFGRVTTCLDALARREPRFE